MLRKFINMFAVCALVVLYACGTSKQNETPAPEGMFALSLSDYGKPFSIWVPDTTSAHLQIEETSDGALNVRSGPDFGISIYEQATDLVLRKNDIMNDEVNKLQSFISDSPSGIMWQSTITTPEFHFVLNKNIGGGEYSFQDIPGSAFSASCIKTMFNSASEATEVHKEK
jgi:hypothetical protein